MNGRSLSRRGLARLHDVLRAHVDRGEVPGLVALVARDDDVHVETLGAMAVGDARPMRRDAIFRIALLAKPITAVAR